MNAEPRIAADLDAKEIGNQIRRIEIHLRGLKLAKEEIATWLLQIDRQSDALLATSKELATAALYTFAMTEAPEVQERSENAKAILREIATTMPRWAMFMDIAAATKIKQGEAQRILRGLGDAGLLESNGTGYTLSEAGKAALETISA